MTELSARRVVAIAALTGALVGGTVASVAAVATLNGNSDKPTLSSGGDRSLTTAPVIRTTLTTSVQEGGSIGYEGSYTVADPAGTSDEQVSQAQEMVTQDQQALTADQTAESDTLASDTQAVAAAQTNADTASDTLSSDQATETENCAGTGSSGSACSEDGQEVSADQMQVAQTQQQLAAARSTATSDQNESQAKVASDQIKLQGDEATLASEETTALNPVTTYTALPKVGEVISQDQSVYSANNESVPLLYGSISAYRAFYVGMSDGADVGELTQDLIALGFGAGLTQSNHYSSATASAVERWQRALGLSATGGILLGQVVFEPGPIRVTSVTPSVGSPIGGGGGSSGEAGTVLTATSTTPIVTIDLDVSQEYLVKPGDIVSIVLPDGTSTVGGHIQTVGNVATCPGGGGTGAATGSSAADYSPCSSSASGTNSTPTVTVTITLDSTPKLATLDQAPVNVDVTTQHAPNVLAVPVTALLALQGGGYGVDVVSDRSTHLVGVTTGLYSNNLVQVSGAGISAGARVQVPSS